VSNCYTAGPYVYILGWYRVVFYLILTLTIVQVTTKYYAGQKILAVIVCHFKKSNCNPYFIVIMITVLIINDIFWVVNFQTRNYFVIFYYTECLLQVIYVQWRAKKVTHRIQSEVRTMYWIVHAKRHDNDVDVSLFLLAIVRLLSFCSFMSDFWNIWALNSLNWLAE
jgi:hypothetical protein